MNKKKLLIIILTVALVLTAGIGSAYAYFSDNSEANGMLKIAPIDTEIKETVIKKEKHATIYSEENAAEVYVRARAFSGNDADLTYHGDGWYDGGDGWWYYGSPGTLSILHPGTQTSELVVNVEKVLRDDAEPGEDLNVIVVYEAARVLYDEVNAAYYTTWDSGGSTE